MTNIALSVAAILTFAIGAVHSWAGERRLIGPLLAPERRQALLDKSIFARRVLRFAWHLTTVAWWGIGAMLVALAHTPVDPSGRLVLWIIAATFLINAIVILLTSRGRNLAWPVFIAIAALSIAPIFSR